MSENNTSELLKEAYSCFHFFQFDKFSYLLDEAKKQLDLQPQRGSLYGEWILLSSITDMRNPHVLCEKYSEALHYMNGRSTVLPPHAHMFGRFINPFAIINPVSGAAEENTEKLGEATELFYKLTGGGSGTDVCARAQLAFFRGDMQKSLSLALEAFEMARKGEQELVALSAADLLAQLSKHLSDGSLWRFAYSYIEAMASGAAGASDTGKMQAEAVLAILSLSVGVLKSLPKWIEQGDYGVVSAQWGYKIIGNKISSGVLPNALLAQISYYCYKGEPIKALNTADILQNVYKVSNVITDIYLDFFRAGCYLQLNEQSSVSECVDRAVCRIAEDGLWTIAAEFAPAYGEIIFDAAQKYRCGASEVIRSIGIGYWDKLAEFRKEIMKCTGVGFTKRESELIPLLRAGKSNAEIAEELFISEKTVKRHVENIYSKLNISRRAQVSEAVSRADFAEAAFWTK